MILDNLTVQAAKASSAIILAWLSWNFPVWALVGVMGVFDYFLMDKYFLDVLKLYALYQSKHFDFSKSRPHFSTNIFSY